GRVSLMLATLIAIVVGVVALWRWFERNRTAVAASLDQRLDRAGATPRMGAVREPHPRLWRVITIRPHAEYLVLHLAVGFLLSLAVIGVFAPITEGLVDSSPLTRFDVQLAALLQNSATLAMLRVFRVVSSLGGRGAMTLLLFAGALVYAVRRRGLEL